MPKVQLENLTPGMVLASNVNDKSGRLLLGKGSEIGPKHLIIFRTWGIVEADIAGVEEPEPEPAPEGITVEQFDNVKGTLLPLYKHSNIEHPAINELLRLAVIRKVKHGSH